MSQHNLFAAALLSAESIAASSPGSGRRIGFDLDGTLHFDINNIERPHDLQNEPWNPTRGQLGFGPELFARTIAQTNWYREHPDGRWVSQHGSPVESGARVRINPLTADLIGRVQKNGDTPVFISAIPTNAQQFLLGKRDELKAGGENFPHGAPQRWTKWATSRVEIWDKGVIRGSADKFNALKLSGVVEFYDDSTEVLLPVAKQLATPGPHHAELSLQKLFRVHPQDLSRPGRIELVACRDGSLLAAEKDTSKWVPVGEWFVNWDAILATKDEVNAETTGVSGPHRSRQHVCAVVQPHTAATTRTDENGLPPLVTGQPGELQLGNSVFYQSATQGKWFGGTVAAISNSMITVTLDGGAQKSVDLSDEAQKLRLRRFHQVGEEVTYHSVSKGAYFPTKVLRVGVGNLSYELELKPGEFKQGRFVSRA